MPAHIQTPRSQWVLAAIDALTVGGLDAIKVEALASALGVSKGGFYHHFDNRAGLLEAVLDHWETSLVDQVILAVDADGGDGRARLRRLFGIADSVAGAGDLELAIRDWARRDPKAAARVGRVDDRRMAYLRPLFSEFCQSPADVEGRCLLVLTLFVGEPLLGSGPGQRKRSTVTAAALRHLLV